MLHVCVRNVMDVCRMFVRRGNVGARAWDV